MERQQDDRDRAEEREDQGEGMWREKEGGETKERTRQMNFLTQETSNSQ